MNTRLSIMAIALLTLTGCGVVTRFVPKSGSAIVGSGHASMRSVKSEGIDSVRVSSIVEVVIVPEGKGGSTLEADDNIINNVTTEVHGSQLVINTKGSISPKGPLRVTLRSVNIHTIDADGACHIVVNNEKPMSLVVNGNGASRLNLNGPFELLDLRLNGACQAEAPKLAGGTIKANLDGASAFTMGGRVDSMTSELAGASIVRLPDEVKATPVIKASSASRVEMSDEQAKTIHPSLSSAASVGTREAPTPPTPPTAPATKTNESR